MKKEKLDIEIFALFHYLRINYEDIFDILERDTRLLTNLINICKNESPNCSIEHYFIERLKNLITNEIGNFSDDIETSSVTKKLDKDDIILIQNMKLKFKALENFKTFFSEKVSIGIDLENYIGVIK